MITQKQLKEQAHYNPVTGVFTRLVAVSRKSHVGDTDCAYSRGYKIFCLSETHFSHRLAFLYMIGWIPREVDHINHIRHDNRWCNLRIATRKTNARNQSISCKNTSGFTGVSWAKVHNKWSAQIKVDGKKTHLGLFEDISKAIAARVKANKKYGFHPNHGK